MGIGNWPSAIAEVESVKEVRIKAGFDVEQRVRLGKKTKMPGLFQSSAVKGGDVFVVVGKREWR